MASEKLTKTGNGGTPAIEEKLYRVTQVVDGMEYERQVPLVGIPFWVPQTREEHPRTVAGAIEDIVEIPANEETGFPARTGIVLASKTTFWVIPAGAAIERQIKDLSLVELLRTAKASGKKVEILIDFAGKAKKAKAGRQPANRFNISMATGRTVPVATQGPTFQSSQQRAS